MNFGQIQSNVSRRLLDSGNVAVSASEVQDAINASIKYWKFRRFWFNEGFQSQTMTAQNALIPLPTDFLVPSKENGGFEIQYGDMRYVLKKVTAAVYDGLWLQNGYGLPAWYSRLATSYNVYPIPDQAYQINCYYLIEYGDLSDADDENDFTIYADRLIMLWTLANLSAELLQDDKMEAYYREAANDEYRNLRVMTNKSNATGSLLISSTLI